MDDSVDPTHESQLNRGGLPTTPTKPNVQFANCQRLILTMWWNWLLDAKNDRAFTKWLHFTQELVFCAKYLGAKLCDRNTAGRL